MYEARRIARSLWDLVRKPWPYAADLLTSGERGGYNKDTGNARAIGSVGERFVHTEEVTGSNPVSPTNSVHSIYAGVVQW